MNTSDQNKNPLPDDEGLTGYLVTLAFILLSFGGLIVGLVQRVAGK